MSRRLLPDFLLQVLTAGCVALIFSTLPAGAKVKYSAMVVDGYTGKMIYGRSIDAPRYPASITKVMTLYIVFEELRAGRLKKSSRLTVSKFASGQAPSRLGLRPGETISLDNAIRALVTKSANDVATVVAENISGTQTKFARRMTKTARRIGMSRTTFRNPHGLPDKRQTTTARDLIKLSMRIQADFPTLYGYFSVKSFTYRGRTFKNHNKLLGRFKGTTGIKTGYIRASGYNLTAVVERGNKKVVAVVMGGKTGRARDAQMRKLISNAFPKVVAYNGPPQAAIRVASLRRASAPVPGRKPVQSIIVAKKTPRVEILPVSGKTDVIAIASRREGVLVMRLAALPPRDRQMPVTEPISRDDTLMNAQIARARAAPLGSINYQRLARANRNLGALATASYAADRNTHVVSSIAALIADTTNSTNRNGVSPAPRPALRPSIPTANQSAGALRPATMPASRPQTRPAKRMARLILPPSSTVDQPSASPAAGLRQALTTPAPIQPAAKPATPMAAPIAKRQAPKPVARAKPTPPPVVLPDGYQIQVGAYVYKQKAEDRIDEVRKAARRLLSEAMGIAVPAENDGGKFYRARFAGLAKRDANRTCRALKKRRIPCIVLSQ